MPKALLPIIILFAIAARIVVGLSLDAKLRFPDSRDYVKIAQNILAGNGPRLNERTVANRGPGYSYFVAGIMALAGGHSVKEGPVGTDSSTSTSTRTGTSTTDDAAGATGTTAASEDARLIMAVRIVQAVLGGVLCWVVYMIGRKLFSPGAGLAAAAVVAVDPILAYFSVLVLSETLFAVLLAGAFACLLYSTDRRTWWAAAAGVLLGLAALVRPPVLLMVPLVAAAWLALEWRKAGSLRAAAVVLVAALVVISPWPIRNYQLTGRAVFTTLSSGASLYEGVCPEADGGPAMDKIGWPTEIAGMNEARKNDFLRARAIECMKAEPARMAKLAVSKFARFWNVFPNFGEYRRPAYMVASGLYGIPVMICIVAGVVLAAGRNRAAWLLLVPAGYFSLLHMVFVGSIRYRAPVMPLLAVFAGVAVATVIERMKARSASAHV